MVGASTISHITETLNEATTAWQTPLHKVVAAVAREFVGFIWAVLREGEIRKEKERRQVELRHARVGSGVAA